MKILPLLLFLLSCNLGFAQVTSSNDCYEVKYMDFFNLIGLEDHTWPRSELENLLTIDFKKDRSDSTIKTNFMVPFILWQMKSYHPKCVAEIDSVNFKLITKLYLKIRDFDTKEIAGKSIEETIDFIQEDFYKQVENEKYLQQMTFTFDDGPFQGVHLPENIELKESETRLTKFGSLTISISEHKSMVVLSAKNKKGKTLWQKGLRGFADDVLSDLTFDDTPFRYTSLATKVYFHSKGEQLTLYLKNDGSFMYYYHSW